MESEEDLGLHRCPRRLSRGSGVGFADDFEMEMMDFSAEGSKKSPVESLDERLDEESAERLKVQDNQDVVTKVLHAEDDPSLNTLTFRVWFIGIGLGIFGAIVDTMYFFRPLSLDVPTIFFALAAYVIGNFMDKAIPRYGFIARWLNPHPFNAKEHVAITILASSSAQVSFAVKVIAAQRLYYSNAPSPALSIIVVISSQCIGYGFVGLFRRALVYPVKMFWPVLLPITSLLEMLHRDRKGTTIQRRVFYWVFATIFVWQLFPEYIMPIMTGLSVLCLANQNSQTFTTIFGGSNPNEGLGFLSLGLNWRFITSQPLWYPLQTLMNGFVGYIICIILFAGIYYGNVWDARNFPFSSQLLYSEASTESNYIPYNQRLLLDQNNKLDGDVVDNRGLPYFAATYATSLLTNNLYITCTIIHLCLWNFGDLKKAWSFLHPANLKRLTTPSFWTSNPEVVDHDEVENNPHYQFMRAYKECPNWWYAAIFLVSLIVGLVCVYVAETTLSWYGYFIGTFLAGILTFFFGAQAAITGYQGNLQPLMQLLGGHIHPGKPIATLYFTLFSHGSITQAISLTQHLKLGQYAKVPPRITFTVQIAGTLVGSIISYIAMAEITKDQRDLLLATRGSSVWSGAHVQELHTQATAFGALGFSLFSASSHYSAIPLSLILGLLLPLPTYLLSRFLPRLSSFFASVNTPLILAYAGVLATIPASSSMLAYFAVGFASQFYLRRYWPWLFVKYNYLVAAALDGGTQVVALLLTFAFKGGVGNEVRFPRYWGNNVGGNWDSCAMGEGLVRDAVGGL